MAAKIERESALLDLYYQDITSSQPLSSQEEIRLALQVSEGDQDARNELASANLKFVVRMAREYQGCGVPVEDLISAGNLGLMTAAERFDGTRGFKFITYASWWIRQSIHQSLALDSRVVRLPANRLRLLHGISSASQKLCQSQAGEPQIAAIAEELGVSEGMVQDTLVRAQHVSSLDSGEDDAQSPLNTLLEDPQNAPDADVIEESDRKQLDTVLNTLENREAKVLRLHFGLAGGTSLTLRQVGRRLGLTRERVRQIKDKALQKLRHPRRREKLDPLRERT